MNLLALIACIFIEILFLTFIVVVLRNSKKKELKTSFAFFMASFALWAAANFLSNVTSLPLESLVVINRILFMVSTVLVVALVGFTATVSGKRMFRDRVIWPISAVVGLLGATPLVVSSVHEESPVTVGVDFGVLAPIYFLHLLVLIVIALVQLVWGLKSKQRQARVLSKVMLVTLGAVVLLLVGTNIVLPVVFGNFLLTTAGQIFGILIVGGVAYAVVRHGMFDVRLAVVRGATYTLTLTTLGAVYFAATLIAAKVILGREFRVDDMMLYTGLSILLVFAFQPIKEFFDRSTSRVFYRDNYDEKEFIDRFTYILASSIDLKRLLEKSAEELAKTLKAEQAFFLVDTGRRVVAMGTEGFSRPPASDVRYLGSVLEQHESTVNVEDLKPRSKIRRLLVSYKVDLVAPLRRNKRTVGYLMLGEHKGRPYTRRDVAVLETISSELSLAIENALAVQEVKDLNATLQQRIDTATDELRRSNAELQRLDEAKDEFVSMASHQLRTPLTSVKGYISMVLDGDVGAITPEQKKLLTEAFTSSDRMVHLINDFLNVSRLQTGKFVLDRELTDLSKLIKQEVDSLDSTIKARDLSIRYTKAKGTPKLYIDEGKIRQVVMNFIDNAMYYSPAGSRIDVDLSVEGGKLIATVQDYGIGVPEDEQGSLFTKFFRASNARLHRPDGTGVGLFLAKRVIHEHGGRIIFKSKEGEGSTFGFSLPIKRLSSAPRDESD